MSKVIILGSGAASGVPTISDGWGKCNADNPKNRRGRAGVYFEDGLTQVWNILIISYNIFHNSIFI